MIPVEPRPEPAHFDKKCRQPGLLWLAKGLGADPHKKSKLWTQFLPDLAQAFRDRCGFFAMFLPDGTVDHWESVQTNPELAFEWRNYRYVAGTLNSAKKPAWQGKLLDPFEVEWGWFEIELPSLELRIVHLTDPQTRARAQFTLAKLGLDNGPKAIGQRQKYWQMYRDGELSLEGLDRMAPLLARAARRELKERRGRCLEHVRRA